MAASDEIDAARAQQNYILYCQGCHLADAMGAPAVVPRMKDFVGSFLQVPGGRKYIARIPGLTSAPLDDEQLAEVLNWVLLTFSQSQLPEDFQPYSADEMDRLRAEPMFDVASSRARLVTEMQRLGVVADDGF